MSMPKYHEVFLPLLKILKGEAGNPATISFLVSAISKELGLSEEEVREKIPSGRVSVIRSRVGWAKSYLKQAGLIEYPKRGLSVITDRGLQVLSQKPDGFNVDFLLQFPEFREFKSRRKDKAEGEITGEDEFTNETPEETFGLAYKRIRDSLASELLNEVKSASPEFFEKVVIDLLLAMGYGGSRTDAGEAVGKSGDGGIDGIIKEDRLGLDIIYIQAKRWGATVGRPEIQKFAGALQGQRAKKGVFITTSNFTTDAWVYAKNIESKIILIDGSQLADFMIDFNIGVSTQDVFEIKKIDDDYFSDE